MKTPIIEQKMILTVLAVPNGPSTASLNKYMWYETEEIGFYERSTKNNRNTVPVWHKHSSAVLYS